MDIGQIGGFVGGVGTAAALVTSWLRSLIAKRDHRIELLEAENRAQGATITELREQKNMLQITAEIQNRFLSQLPASAEAPHRTGGHT